MAEYRHLAVPHAVWANFPNNLPPNTRTLRMTRDKLPIKQEEGLDVEEFDIPARDDYPIAIRSYRQSSLHDHGLPTLIYLHGGGYVTGGLETDDASCRAVATQIPILVLSVEYRLAPEHKFPIGFEDAFDVVKWVALPENEDKIKADLAKGFLLGGTSAGANFTAGIAHLVRDNGIRPPLTGLMFLAGSFCHPDARPEEYRDRILSVDEIDDAPGLTRKSIDYFAAKYGAPPDDHRLSPLLFKTHAHLAPKAVFYICGWDPRRDEEFLFEDILSQNGTITKKFVYPGLPHGFWTTCPDLPMSRAWEKDLLEGVRFLLG